MKKLQRLDVTADLIFNIRKSRTLTEDNRQAYENNLKMEILETQGPRSLRILELKVQELVNHRTH